MVTQHFTGDPLKSHERSVMEELIVVDLVLEKRHLMPRLGDKKLYSMLIDELQCVGRIGRDKFFDILRRNDLLVKRKKSFTKTTDSYHRFHCWKNIVKGRTFTRPNEYWVSDITYLRTMKGFVYLFLITDLYSRKIVGWNLNQSLSIEGAEQALSMALRQRNDKTTPLTHHSDRGIQYCSHVYVSCLQRNNISISMTEENHCYENSTAERVNGILKDEFSLDRVFRDYQDAYKAAKDSIRIYNNVRPHWSLNLCTPSNVHQQKAA